MKTRVQQACHVSKMRWLVILIIIMVLVTLCTMISKYEDVQDLKENSHDLVANAMEDSSPIGTQYRMAGPIPIDDPQLLQYVRERYLIPPSTEPYVLQLHQQGKYAQRYNKYRENAFSWRYLNEVIKSLFSDEPPGFFVEAGAFDGEYNSNTLDMESKWHWKGLLVEVDSELVASLLKKNRRAWVSRVCLAAFPYPYETTLVKFTNHQNAQNKFTLDVRFYNALQESSDLQQRMQHGFPIYETAQCLPLQTLLLALNITHVNFVSLDVEGVETDVLESFFKAQVVTVDVWAVEHKHPNTVLGTYDRVHPKFIYWFESKGYRLYTYGYYSPQDYVFIRNGSNIYEKAFATRPQKFIKTY